MKNNSVTFDQSTQLDAPDEFAVALQSRRLATYSVEALRMAKAVDKVFVMTPNAVHCLKAMDRLFQLGSEFEMQQGMRLIGPPGVGKTKLFSYFRASLPSSALFAAGHGAIGIRVHQKPRTGHILQALFNSIRYPFSGGSGKQLYMRRHILFDALKNCRTRLLWVDEAHHLLHSRGSINKNDAETDATELLHELIDECPISLVLSGSKKLDDIENEAPHLASRVTIREEIGYFSADPIWIGFVRAFVKQSPSFDLQFMSDPQVCMRLHHATNGSLRDFKRLVTESVLVAADRGQKTLDQAALSSAFQLIFGASAMRSNPFV
jgi:hypothetical protein